MIPLYRRVVARHQIGILCIGGSRRGFADAPPRKTAMFSSLTPRYWSFIFSCRGDGERFFLLPQAPRNDAARNDGLRGGATCGQ